MCELCCVLKEREENTSCVCVCVCVCVCEGAPEFLVFVFELLIITYVP